MNKLKLFYSYCHENSEYKTHLDKWLSVLKDQGVIKTWHDKEILAGEPWKTTIDKNLKNSDIVLFLITVDFLSSDACKKEINRAKKLNKRIIPILIDNCPWNEFVFKDGTKLGEMQFVPTTTKGQLTPISQWQSQNEAWEIVVKSLKEIIDIESKINSIKLSEQFSRFLTDCEMFSKSHSKKEILQLKDIFIHPELKKQKEQKNENVEIVDSKKILNCLFEDKRLHIVGDDQSGKTSLCKVIYQGLIKKKYFPVFLDSHTGGSISNRIESELKSQYELHKDINFSLIENKITPIVDNFHTAKNKEKLIPELLEYPVHIIVTDQIFTLDFQDENLSKVQTKYCRYEIQEYSASYRDDLIRKWLSVSDTPNNNDFHKELDKKTELVDSTLGKILDSGIMPSYPFFVLSIISIYETGAKPLDQQITSQGYCYQSLIYLYFRNQGVKNEDFDTYINFLSSLAFHLFDTKSKELSLNGLGGFIKEYKSNYVLIIKNEILLRNLEESGIFIRSSINNYYFRYSYLYYYFVAKYIADNLGKHKKEVDLIVANLHKNENAYIAIFISHHSTNQYVLDEIWLNANCLFENNSPATLDKKDVSFMDEKVKKIINEAALEKHGKPDRERRKRLNSRNAVEKKNAEKSDLESGNQKDNGNELRTEIRRSIKTAEVMGHIIRNRVGSLPKDQVKDIFKNAMNIYFRLLSSYFELIKNETDQELVITYLHERLDDVLEKKSISTGQRRRIAEKIFWNMNFDIVLAVVGRVVFSLGSDKLVQIAEDIHKEMNTPISFLAKHGMRMAYSKNIAIDEIRKEIQRGTFSDTAITAMKHIIAHHCRLHNVGYRDRQKISSKFNIKLLPHKK